jgi:hypothetical protein
LAGFSYFDSALTFGCVGVLSIRSIIRTVDLGRPAGFAGLSWLLALGERGMGETFSEKHERLNEEALERLYPIYGEAMLAWSNIEDTLCGWFHYLSGMGEPQARAVFFSARSFAGRADMLSALLSVPAGKPLVTDFVRDVLNKSLGYSQARNQLAHRVPVINTSNEDSHIVELHEGGTYPFLTHPPILAAHLTIISTNYINLGLISRHAWVVARQKRLDPDERQKQLREFHERLLLLPNLANSSAPSRKQQGRARASGNHRERNLSLLAGLSSNRFAHPAYFVIHN